jgi:hypothetical protein
VEGHLLPDPSRHLLQHQPVVRGEREVLLLLSLAVGILLLLLRLWLRRLLLL